MSTTHGRHSDFKNKIIVVQTGVESIEVKASADSKR